MPTRRDDTFLLYYLEDFTEFETENQSCLYCLSDSTVEIILSALRFATWPTRWRIDRNDNDRRVRNGNVDIAKAWGDLAIWEVSHDMGCDFEAGFNAIASAIENASNADAVKELAQAVVKMAQLQCCNGQANVAENGGVVSTWTDGEGTEQPIYGQTDLPTLPEEGFPPEFESLEAYQLSKCQMANMVFDGWLLTMRGLGALTVFNATALAGIIGLVFASVIVMPPVAIPIMIGLLITLGSFVAMFETICDSLLDHKAEIVCDLYNSDTVEEMTTALGEALDDAIGLLGVAGPVGGALKGVAMLVVNGDTLSKILSGAASIGYPDVDCSDCVCEKIVYDFLASDNGYVFAADSCFGTTPSSAGAGVSWSSSGLRLSAPHVGSANFVNAAGPTIAGLEIQLGWELVVTGHRVANFNNFTRIDAMMTEDGCNQLQTGGFTALTDTQIISSLDTWAGKHLEQINIFVGNSISQPVDVEVTNIMVRCAGGGA